MRVKVLKNKDELIKKVKIYKATDNYLYLKLKDNLTVVEDVDVNNKYNYNVSVFKYSFPIKKGQILGKIDVIYNNKVISSGDLISLNDINSLNILDLYKNNYRDLFLGKI